MIAVNHKENGGLESGLREERETHGLKLIKGLERLRWLKRASEGFVEKEALGWDLQRVRITQAHRSKEGFQPSMKNSQDKRLTVAQELCHVGRGGV